MNWIIKFWPHILGLGVLLIAATLNSQKFFNKAPTSGPTRPSKPVTQLQLPAPAHAVTVEPALICYQLIGEQILNKLRSKDMTLTLAEYNEAVRRSGDILKDQLEITLPPGFVRPVSIPANWMANPTYMTSEAYKFKRTLLATNQVYVKTITTRLIEEYAGRVMPPFVECLQGMKALRKSSDEASRAFVHGLYGNDYIEGLTVVIQSAQKAPQPQPKNRPKNKSLLRKPVPVGILPLKEVEKLDEEAVSLWRTEFSDEEFLMLKDVVISNEWTEMLRDDFFFNDMSAVQHAYVEASHLGYRLNFIHSQTQFLLTGKIQYALSQPQKR